MSISEFEVQSIASHAVEEVCRILERQGIDNDDELWGRIDDEVGAEIEDTLRRFDKRRVV